jgi:hypothetical protein
MITKNLYGIVEPYVDRIKEFYEFDPEDKVSLKLSLRHIEIIRIQITSQIEISNLSEDESEFIYSILSDSFYFEKYKSESTEWKVNFLRITWNRLLSEMGIEIDKNKVEILKNTYVDSNTREDGRYIYRRYKNE